MAQRRDYIVSTSFRTYLTATILTMVIEQLCLIFDGIIMSHLMGPDAMSAINLMGPFGMIVGAVFFLFAVGGSILAGKAIGRQDFTRGRQVFTVSVLAGLVASVAIIAICLPLQPQLVQSLCPDARLQPYLRDYMRMYLLVTPIVTLSGTLKQFTGVDGSPAVVTRAVILTVILNVAFDVLLVAGFGMGLDGSALATGIGELGASVVMLRYVFSSRSSLGFERHVPNWKELLLDSVKESSSLVLSIVILPLVMLGVNRIVLDAQGADGAFILSICNQSLSFTMLALAGCSNALSALGSVMVGEKDYEGLRMLFDRAFWLTIAFTALVTVLILIWPEGLASLFGGSSQYWKDLCRTPLREYVLVFVPYAVYMISRFVYLLTDHRVLSAILSTMTFVLLLPAIWIMARLIPEHIWLAYPSVALLSLAFQLVSVTWISRKEKNEVYWFTLIPKEDGVTNKKSFSISYDRSDLEDSLVQLNDYLKGLSLSDTMVFRTSLVVEELAKNIISHAVAHPRQRQCFDLMIRLDDDGSLNLVVKDDGKPFDPLSQKPRQYTAKELLELDSSELRFGLLLAKNSCSEMSYRAMYGLNITYVTIKEE